MNKRAIVCYKYSSGTQLNLRNIKLTLKNLSACLLLGLFSAAGIARKTRRKNRVPQYEYV